MSLRVMLIEPPFYRLYGGNYGQCRAPLGLGSLAAALLTETDAVVRILHADFHPAPAPFDVRHLTGEGFRNFRAALRDPAALVWTEVRQAIMDFQPDVVGISAKTPAWTSALACARLTREAVPRAFILAGGPHPSAVGREALDTPGFDAVALGEGERTLVELAHRLSRDEKLEGTAGLLLRSGGFKPRQFIEDLDGLPFPHEAVLETAAGARDWPAQAFGHVFAARGCPYACSYCASRTIWGRKPRLRSVENVAREVAVLKRLGTRHVHFDDDTFGVTHHRLLHLCAALEAFHPAMTFSCETHVNLVTPESAAALAKAGFSAIQIGLESGDEGTLGRIGKGFRVEAALAACRCVKASGMRLETFFMVGFPDETEESLAATRRLMEMSGADKIIYSIFTPYPGTPLHGHCRNLGLVGPGYDYSLHNHQSPENSFCPGLGPRFRELATEMETFVSVHNASRRQEAQTAP